MKQIVFASSVFAIYGVLIALSFSEQLRGDREMANCASMCGGLPHKYVGIGEICLCRVNGQWMPYEASKKPESK